MPALQYCQYCNGNVYAVTCIGHTHLWNTRYMCRRHLEVFHSSSLADQRTMLANAKPVRSSPSPGVALIRYPLDAEGH